MKLKRRNAVVELADGRVLEVRILNPDTLRFEETARRLGWPGITVEDGVARVEGSSLRTTFEVYAALKRTGQYDGDWERFKSTDCLDVTVQDVPVDPTQPGPGSDSVPSSHGSADGPSPSSETQTTSS